MENQIFNALGDAGVRSNLNSKDLLELSIPFPSLNEQQRIAEFWIESAENRRIESGYSSTD